MSKYPFVPKNASRALFFFVWKFCLLFMSAAYIQVHFRLDFFMEANNMNPDQTALLGVDWSRSILFAVKVTEVFNPLLHTSTFGRLWNVRFWKKIMKNGAFALEEQMFHFP